MLRTIPIPADPAMLTEVNHTGASSCTFTLNKQQIKVHSCRTPSCPNRGRVAFGRFLLRGHNCEPLLAVARCWYHSARADWRGKRAGGPAGRQPCPQVHWVFGVKIAAGYPEFGSRLSALLGRLPTIPIASSHFLRRNGAAYGRMSSAEMMRR